MGQKGRASAFLLRKNKSYGFADKSFGAICSPLKLRYTFVYQKYGRAMLAPTNSDNFINYIYKVVNPLQINYIFNFYEQVNCRGDHWSSFY